MHEGKIFDIRQLSRIGPSADFQIGELRGERVALCLGAADMLVEINNEQRHNRLPRLLGHSGGRIPSLSCMLAFYGTHAIIAAQAWTRWLLVGLFWDALPVSFTSRTRADLSPRGIAMTLKPIQGAPPGAPVPDFPTGEPGPLVVPASRFMRRPAEPFPFSLPRPAPAPQLSPVRQPGPLEIGGDGDSTLTFRCIPEVPAINRSSMTISITGEQTPDASPQMMPRLDLTTDEARAFLLALRDGNSPIVIADSRTAFQVEFVIAEDGPTFTVSKLGQRTTRRFNVGWGYDVKTMAAHLLADLGP
jgi:hypothetical protein